MHRSIILGTMLATLLVGTAAGAGDTYSAGGLTIVHPWARATAGHARAASAYLTIRNAGNADDRLIAVAAGSVAGMAMLHTHVMEGNVMKMRHVDAIVVVAGGTAALKPGGDHVMLMDLKAPLTEGQKFPMTLTFEKAGTVTVEVEVESIGARGKRPKKHR